MTTKEDLVEKTWRDAEKVFKRCLLHLAEQLEGKDMSASQGLREMARMFEPDKTEVCIYYQKRTLQ